MARETTGRRDRIRGALLSLVAACAVAYVGFGQAFAQVDRELLALGAQLEDTTALLALATRDPAGSPVRRPGDATGERVLVINGQRVRITTGASTTNLEGFLAGVDARCARGDGLAGEGAEALGPARRRMQDDVGFVACLDVGRDELDLAAWRTRLAALQETGDLSALGDFRYTYATRRGEGETRFVRLEVIDSLRLEALSPERGRDVPGPELAQLPRPPGGDRILSAYEEREPYLVSMFAGVPEEPEAFVGRYRALLDPGVWQEVDLPEGRATPGLFLLHREEPARFAFVHVRRAADDDAAPEEALRTMVTVVEAR
ncbi:MAG: hypothetical protein AAGH15_08325 [Myxococcota bacterium]